MGLKIYNSLGDKITTLDEGFREQGERRAPLNMENHPPGLYFFTIKAGCRTVSGKMVLVK